MAERLRLDPAEVATAIRDLLRKDTDRVDDPHPIPEDRGGWHADNPLTPDAPGAPVYEPESWRWFELVDVGFVDEMVLIVFRWTDPATPELRYSFLAHADQLPNAASIATVIRGQLRTLLQPGWRDRVEKQWLSRDKVLIRRPHNRPDRAHSVIRDQVEAMQDQMREEIWHKARTTPA
ncbi:hypothetical protein [Amnibacterium endophyticum]|uniref:Type II toxin-antitoxin system PemK/MazF family toxin n=1 Tax=Amnibacterium endophyticum TaxID=2109337 RepID=A0ABW4LFW8_9MICO